MPKNFRRKSDPNSPEEQARVAAIMDKLKRSLVERAEKLKKHRGLFLVPKNQNHRR